MKKNLFVEAIKPESWADDSEHDSFIVVLRSWVRDHDEVDDVFLSIPYHQDFYEVLRDYCRYYEKFMLKKFEEKWKS